MNFLSDSDDEPPVPKRHRVTKWRRARGRTHGPFSSDEGSDADDRNLQVGQEQAAENVDEGGGGNAPEVPEFCHNENVCSDNDDDDDDDWSQWSFSSNNSSSDSEPELGSDEEREELDVPIIHHHSSSSESSNSDDDANFDFQHQSLNRVIDYHRETTVKESLLLSLALSIRHKQTYECLLDSLKAKNVELGHKYFPKKELWRILGRNSSGVQAHIYCGTCSSYIGRRSALGDVIRCTICHVEVRKNVAKYFITLSLRKQLSNFVALPGVAEQLRFRETRTKHQPDSLEDMMDGAMYKKIKVDGQYLHGSRNYTYTFFEDGCKIKKGAKTTFDAVFARVNELPPKLRQKHMFLIGLFVDTKAPNMQTFLKPVVKQINDVATNGVKWKPDGVNEVTSKFIAPIFNVDGKAKWQILNMTSHSGHFGCTECTYYGVMHGVMRYPLEHPDLPPYEMRTHEGMLEAMVEAAAPGVLNPRNPSVQGHRGPTVLALVEHLDLVNGGATDDLHFFYECGAFNVIGTLLKSAPRIDNQMGYELLCNTVDLRLRACRTPSCISRKPGTCKVKNLKQMNGTELRNMLLFVSVPALEGLIRPAHLKVLELLSHATYLLSMDIITEEDINKADRFIRMFLQRFEELYGIDVTRLNLHRLLHAAQSVRNWAGLWCYSTFNFESWNHKLMQWVTSPKGAILQIVMRHLLTLTLQLGVHADEAISAPVKEQILSILAKKRRKDGLPVGDHMYLRGNPLERDPSEEERRVLRLEDIEMSPTEKLQVFKAVSIRSVDYRVESAQTDEMKSDDTTVYTYENTFCTLVNIVKFTDTLGNAISGAFVKEHDVVHPSPFEFASHIKQIKPASEDIFHFIRLKDVRSPVVKVNVPGKKFFIPMPNACEID